MRKELKAKIDAAISAEYNWVNAQADFERLQELASKAREHSLNLSGLRAAAYKELMEMIDRSVPE